MDKWQCATRLEFCSQRIFVSEFLFYFWQQSLRRSSTYRTEKFFEAHIFPMYIPATGLLAGCLLFNSIQVTLNVYRQAFVYFEKAMYWILYNVVSGYGDERVGCCPRGRRNKNFLLFWQWLYYKSIALRHFP